MPLRFVPQRDRKLNRLVKAAHLSGLAKGEVLYGPGDPCLHVYLVRAGFVRLVDATGERTVGLVGPSELLGEEALNGSGRRYRAVAGERTAYQSLEGPQVGRVVRSSERTFAALLEAWARDLETARLLTSGPGSSAEGRLALVLLDLARRWGGAVGKGVQLSQRIPHRVLGDLAGVHRSTVTTTLNDWLYRGILGGVRRGFLVARPDQLAALAGCSGQDVPRGGAAVPYPGRTAAPRSVDPRVPLGL